MTKIIPLKVWPEFFEEIRAGRKRFEWRERRDRDFRVGDVLFLREWDPESLSYTGRRVYSGVRYILDGPGFGIPEGYCIMSLDSPIVLC